jgi:hypothetical protein
VTESILNILILILIGVGMRSVKKWVAGLGLGSGILYLSKDYIQEGLNDLMGMIVDKVEVSGG